MQIQHFYSTFTLQTARDTHGKSIDRFDAQAAAILDLVEEYLQPDTTYPRRPTSPSQKGSNAQLYPYTPLPQQQEYCFALEYAILPTLFSICLRIRHSATRKRALHLLRTANRREAGQSSAELCHYADAFIALEESSPSDAVGEVAEEGRLLEVVIESAGYMEVSFVCGRFRHEGDGGLEVLEYKGAGLPPLRLQLMGKNEFPFMAGGIWEERDLM
ncbi:hypothetical protein D6C99_09219 [Aureobasidium pullulans]|nr:hypothetical protein D6C99_09219 [Aureobasidium pullulans]